jgi:hypothetical protein
MRVELSSGQVLQIDWEHAHFNPPTSIDGVLVQGSTTCIVGPVEQPEQSVGAVAFCSIRDTFEKEKGRKVSLTRVLRKAGLPKADRERIWNAYRRRA